MALLNFIAIDLQRYGIVPQTEAEVAAAMQQTSGNADDSLTSRGQAVAGAPGSEVYTLGQPSHATQLQILLKTQDSGNHHRI
jgi:hypothetical protein